MREAPPPAAAIDDNVIAGLVAMHAPLEVIEEARAQQQPVRPPDEHFPVWASNWETWLVFLQVQRQWVYAGMSGQRVSLNYPGIETHFRMSRLPRSIWAERWADLQVIENAVLLADYQQQQNKRN